MASKAYIQHLSQGAFVGKTDPWAEAGYYFSQLHSGIIAAILAQIWQPLLERGYTASKEASLQIAELRKPDIAVHQRDFPPVTHSLDYVAVAQAVLAEPGMIIDLEEPEFQAIYIRDSENVLVTVVEIISPRNKTYMPEMLRYQEERSRLFIEQNVNVVEIDLTRSVKRLVNHTITTRSPYYIAVFIPNEPPRVITMELNESLKRFALPLRETVIAVDLQAAYDTAYREATSAPQLESNSHYTLEYLPFPTLLTDEEQNMLMEAVKVWNVLLKQLRK